MTERAIDEAARKLRQPRPCRDLPAESYTPIEPEHFNATTASLAVCDTCGFIWNHPQCDAIDSGEFSCPRCGAFDCGPLYREEER